MRGLRKIWLTSLILALLFVCTQGTSRAACIDPAPITVTPSGGDTLTSSVSSPDQNEWTGWVTITVVVDGETYTFSYQVTAPAGGGSRTHLLYFSDTPILQSYQACQDPNGMTESSEPVAIAEMEP